MKRNKAFTSKYAYVLLSLLVAILLFLYVNSTGMNLTRESNSNSTALQAVKKSSVNVPLQINADMNKYFITGYPQNINVTIEGPSALVTTTVNTKNFQISADLSHLGVGKHQVKLSQTGLNRDLNYSLSPAEITVEIRRRKEIRLPIQMVINKNAVAKGYSASDPVLSTSEAVITGPEEEVNRVASVVAQINMPRDTKTNFDQNVSLQALDQNGQTVNVILAPSTIQVNVKVKRNSKKVQLNALPEDVKYDKQYEIKIQPENATVYGDNDALSKLDEIDVPVSLDGIDKETTKEIKLKLPTGITSDLSEVKVNIKPK